MIRSILQSGGGFVQSRGFQMMEPSSSPARTLSSQADFSFGGRVQALGQEAYATRQTASAECSAWRPMAWTPSMRFAPTRLPQEDRSSVTIERSIADPAFGNRLDSLHVQLDDPAGSGGDCNT